MFKGMLALVRSGFLAKVRKIALSSYGMATIMLVVLSYFFGVTQPGSHEFTILYLAIGVVMLWAWKSVEEFSPEHLFLLFFAAILTRYFMLPFAVSGDMYSYIGEGKTLGPAALLIVKAMGQIQASSELFKQVFIGFDLAVIYVLFKLLNSRGRNLKSLIFYTANPLVLVVFAGEAQLDVLQIFFVLCAFWAQDKKNYQLAALLLGLAVGVKFSSILFLPFLIRKENFYAIISCLAGFILPALYLEVSMAKIFDPLFEVTLAKTISFLLLTAFVGGYWLTQDNTVRGALLSMIAFLLLTPAMQPGSLAIVIALAVLVRSPLAILWSISSVFYYSYSFNGQAVQYVPVIIFLFYLCYAKVRGLKALGTEVEGSVSVLIPVLNEVENAKQIMQDLHAQTYRAKEVIVIDGGSIDGAAKKFLEAGAKVLHCAEKGRGNQLLQGLEEAIGDYIVILHADKRIDKSALAEVAWALETQSDLVGGAIGAHFDSSLPKYRVIEFLNNFRMALCGISFGDQGQFFKREIVLKNDLLKRIPLMEDVDLAIGLQAQGKITKLRGGLNVSTRRWLKKKVISNTFQIFFLFIKYLLLRRILKDVKVECFYESYYSEKPSIEA